MSGTASTSVVMGGGGELGYGGGGTPFTAVQWQELEHQAMIYKYLVAGLPVPPDLVMPIRRNFEALSARFFPHPSLGYCSYYGKKFDPEPGRCRRTDGKKWRCSKDAHPHSKYCERHMHRGRNRSRKPVESQNTSQSLSTAMTQISNACGNNNNNSNNSNNTNNNNTNNSTGSFQVTASGTFQNIPLYSVPCSESLSFGSNITKLQMEPVNYEMDNNNNNKEFRYIHDHAFSSEASGNFGTGTWRLMPSQVSSTSFVKQKYDAFEPIETTIPKQRQQQHCFLGGEIGGSPKHEQQQQHPVHPFFSEWPMAKEPWSSLDDDAIDGSNKNAFSTTQLSISIPRTSDFSSRSGYSPNDS